MCDFKVGDEVVALTSRGRGRAPAWMIWTRIQWVRSGYPVKGRVYTVSSVGHGHSVVDGSEGVWISLAGFPDKWDARLFRKVQRRDLSAWLSAENTIEGPVRPRVPA